MINKHSLGDKRVLSSTEFGSYDNFCSREASLIFLHSLTKFPISTHHPKDAPWSIARIFDLKCHKSQELNEFLQILSNNTLGSKVGVAAPFQKFHMLIKSDSVQLSGTQQGK
jgi:hypothetical protein